jgi:hypothetical protein
VANVRFLSKGALASVSIAFAKSRPVTWKMGRCKTKDHYHRICCQAAGLWQGWELYRTLSVFVDRIIKLDVTVRWIPTGCESLLRPFGVVTLDTFELHAPARATSGAIESSAPFSNLLDLLSDEQTDDDEMWHKLSIDGELSDSESQDLRARCKCASRVFARLGDGKSSWAMFLRCHLPHGLD